jgi:hypothetical protein
MERGTSICSGAAALFTGLIKRHAVEMGNRLEIGWHRIQDFLSARRRIFVRYCEENVTVREKQKMYKLKVSSTNKAISSPSEYNVI